MRPARQDLRRAQWEQGAVVRVEQTGALQTPMVVWNCPAKGEATRPRESKRETGRIGFLYHGSIVPDRLPLSIVDALAGLPGEVSLTVVGYETVGSLGYLKKMYDRGGGTGDCATG